MNGSGKSELIKRLIHEWLAAGRVVVAFDVDDELSRHGAKLPGVTPGPLRDRCTVRELLADPDRWLGGRDVSLAVVPEDPNEDGDDVARQFVAFSKWVRIRARRGREAGLPDLVFVCEELGYWADPEEATGHVKAAIRRLKAIACKWRKQGVALVVCCQMLTQIPEKVRQQVSKFVCFQQVKASALSMLARETDRGFADSTVGLDVGEYVTRELRARPAAADELPVRRGRGRSSSRSTKPRQKESVT
jgi:hypothetical protein